MSVFAKPTVVTPEFLHGVEIRKAEAERVIGIFEKDSRSPKDDAGDQYLAGNKASVEVFDHVLQNIDRPAPTGPKL